MNTGTQRRGKRETDRRSVAWRECGSRANVRKEKQEHARVSSLPVGVERSDVLCRVPAQRREEDPEANNEQDDLGLFELARLDELVLHLCEEGDDGSDDGRQVGDVGRWEVERRLFWCGRVRGQEGGTHRTGGGRPGELEDDGETKRPARVLRHEPEQEEVRDVNRVGDVPMSSSQSDAEEGENGREELRDEGGSRKGVAVVGLVRVRGEDDPGRGRWRR